MVGRVELYFLPLFGGAGISCCLLYLMRCTGHRTLQSTYKTNTILTAAIERPIDTMKWHNDTQWPELMGAIFLQSSLLFFFNDTNWSGFEWQSIYRAGDERRAIFRLFRLDVYCTTISINVAKAKRKSLFCRALYSPNEFDRNLNSCRAHQLHDIALMRLRSHTEPVRSRSTILR